MRHIPCTVQNMCRSYVCDQLFAFIRIQKIHGMELTDSTSRSSSRCDVDVESTVHQGFKRPMSYKTGSAGDKDGTPLHRISSSDRKSGQPASRSEITRGSMGHWMAKVGSFHRAPLAELGS